METEPAETRRCALCRLVKPVAEFHRQKRTYGDGIYGYVSYCKPCRAIQRRKYYDAEKQAARYVANKEKIAIYAKAHYVLTREQRATKARAKLIEMRNETITAYGGGCACCGETEYTFLTVDHINGGGKAHRQEVGRSTAALHRWLRNNGYPKEDFRILCFNCNSGTYLNGGICPHQKNG